MPNQANKSKDKSGIVQKKKKPTVPAKEHGTDGNATKNSKGGNAQKGNTAKDKSKTSSGGSQSD